ncbi:MAG: tRNA guanosine(34) transglycosylase Tgt [Patescibacteria group bacterium]|nr:tRNA guanosine(34) transglycosylase Tgt [Patescibacteria group bacterium]
MISSFILTHTDKKARRGVLSTKHGEIQTPAFMPVATLGAIKAGIEPRDLRALGADIILSNTYHLSLRPGESVIKQAGGLSKFIGWNGPILTDSGGFQVFSLANINNVDDYGVTFQSHIDGAKLRFTPERAMQIQHDLDSSIAMCFDECTIMTAPENEVERAVMRTTNWAKRCKIEHDKLLKSENNKESKQLLFGIIQGGLIPKLCKRSAEEIIDLDFDGYALGGASNGLPISKETRAMTTRLVDLRVPFLPHDKPRYLMGLGTPLDILEAVERGIDMFDCVLPARMARHGVLYTSFGQLRIKRAEYITDFTQIDAECDCPLCDQNNGYTKAYLRHLFSAKEDLARRLSTLHNLRFYLRLMQEIRQNVENGSFTKFKKDCIKKFCV